MKNIIYKELKLFVNPIAYFMLLLSALLVIPSYPAIVGVSYSLLSISICFNIARANNDNVFTAMLPIPRNDIVKGKHFSISFIELLQILTAVPFAVVSLFVTNKNGNIVGLDANLTYFGITFICYGVFNLVFMPWYFKTGYKAGIPMIVGVIAYCIVYVAAELLIGFTNLKLYIDGINVAYVGYRIIVLISGILFYIVTLIVSNKISKKNFERVTL
ncbi:MAG: ABC-2 transporter permease [Acidaminococcus sp.]|nr:ABC-2 transporter permease [Acidaminococcus sp.]MDD7398613.1 ABC-2 transporter permease [Bacillota bacterium]MDY5345555.1 ABC-2 transporter permease [Eubacteriales bacterium]